MRLCCVEWPVPNPSAWSFLFLLQPQPIDSAQTAGPRNVASCQSLEISGRANGLLHCGGEGARREISHYIQLNPAISKTMGSRNGEKKKIPARSVWFSDSSRWVRMQKVNGKIKGVLIEDALGIWFSRQSENGMVVVVGGGGGGKRGDARWFIFLRKICACFNFNFLCGAFWPIFIYLKQIYFPTFFLHKLSNRTESRKIHEYTLASLALHILCC